MAVPTSFTGISTTPGSNSPVAGDDVFPDLDDFLRILTAFAASIYNNTATNGWVSPYASKANLTSTGNTTLGSTTGDTLDVAGGKITISAGGVVALSSPSLTGTPVVPTAAVATSTTQAASTAFVQAAIANVNAQTATTLSIDSAASITAVAGQHIVCTNVSAVTITLPASPAAGDTVWVTPGNALTTNVIARNSSNIMSLAENMTVNNASATVALRYINAGLGWRLV
jgi:hypothetical protein